MRAVCCYIPFFETRALPELSIFAHPPYLLNERALRLPTRLSVTNAVTYVSLPKKHLPQLGKKTRIFAKFMLTPLDYGCYAPAS